MKQWIDDNPGNPYDPLLPRADGTPFTRSGIERWARSWGEAAKVQNCTTHRFRRYLATDLLRLGVPVEVIQRILGHISITTTMAYTRLPDAATIRALKVPLR